MTTEFTEEYRIGNAFGPGKAVVGCKRCGSILLPEDKDLHTEFHTQVDRLFWA